MSTDSLLPTSGTWTLYTSHSFIGFSVNHHAFATFRAKFGEVDGEYDGASGALTGTARADSVETIPMLRELLASDAFFGAAHPTISFVSTSVQADGERLTVDGELTLRGVARPVRAVGTVSRTSRVGNHDGTISDHFGMNLETTIDRREFGIEFNQILLDGNENIGWDVTMEFALEWRAMVEDATA